ncbi:hypothetical protein [Pseudoroseomonas cervicalis]|uniref:hypothetical protein n=1 Tax=Teichococcus cervicalis TaxID=204525 RepID=UPI00277D4701|nr:hypothetical protein [Pseudoroseomonas cervicalis]MDQ1079697.1 hypothetical protein [Pseudoroseomonas cervicalis]
MSDTLAPIDVRIARALHDRLSHELAASEIPVELERSDAVTASEVPSVQLYWANEEVEADFIGGRQMVRARYTAECIADVGEAEEDAVKRPAESLLSAMVLVQQCRDAVLSDRTLGGLAISLETARGEPGRALIDEDITSARAEALVISVFFIRDRS